MSRTTACLLLALLAAVFGCRRNSTEDYLIQVRRFVPSALQAEISKRATPLLSDEDLGRFSRDIAFIIYGIDPKLGIRSVKPIEGSPIDAEVVLFSERDEGTCFRFVWDRHGFLRRLESVPTD